MQVDLSLNHVYMDFLNHINYETTAHMPIRTDIGSDCDDKSDDSIEDYETADEGGWEYEETQSENMFLSSEKTGQLSNLPHF